MLETSELQQRLCIMALEKERTVSRERQVCPGWFPQPPQQGRREGEGCFVLLDVGIGSRSTPSPPMTDQGSKVNEWGVHSPLPE